MVNAHRTPARSFLSESLDFRFRETDTRRGAGEVRQKQRNHLTEDALKPLGPGGRGDPHISEAEASLLKVQVPASPRIHFPWNPLPLLFLFSVPDWSLGLHQGSHPHPTPPPEILALYTWDGKLYPGVRKHGALIPSPPHSQLSPKPLGLGKFLYLINIICLAFCPVYSRQSPASPSKIQICVICTFMGILEMSFHFSVILVFEA